MLRRFMDPADRDAYLDSVLVGGREPRQIVIVDYDPEWPERFAAERDRISAALGPDALAVLHVGSTSVPGLAAKPIVDVLVVVSDVEDEVAFVPALEAAGYVLRVREPGHRMLRTPELDVHVHVLSDGDGEIDRMVRFRDTLRRSEDDRLAYEQLKRSLAEREWRDMNAYADAKGALIERILSHPGTEAPTSAER
jgi:GrpB-like predicted nucleotidyltransferase (UPF0157 family)